MKYFAYGEKMLSPELTTIVNHADVLGVVKAVGYRLFFHHRRDDDPSGKCNIVPVDDRCEQIYGVLYDINAEGKALLDRAEKVGSCSEAISLTVYPVDKGMLSEQDKSGLLAVTHVAKKENVFEDLVPFSWYKAMVIHGAKQHQLPQAYIDHLDHYASSQDPNAQRAKKQMRYLGSLFSPPLQGI